MITSLLPNISDKGQHRGKRVFVYRINGKPHYRVIQTPDSPKAVEQEKQALIASLLAGGIKRVKTLQQALVDSDYAATANTHLYDFLKQVPGKNPVHKINLLQRLVRMLKAAGIRHAHGITEVKIAKVIAELRCSPRKPKKDPLLYPLLSEQSRHHHRRHFKQLTHWLTKQGILKSDPLSGMQCPKVRIQRKRRDCLQAAELATLISTIEATANVRLYTGPELAMLYRLAAFTGLRKSELATLTPESFKWQEAVVVVREGETKNDDRCDQPLPPGLLPLLRPWVESRPAGMPLFPQLAEKDLADLIQRDMKQAELPLRTAEGSRTFHSLRNSYVCLLLEATNNNVVLVQRLARHKDVATTLSYCRYTTDDARQAVAALPGLLSGPAVVQTVVQG